MAASAVLSIAGAVLFSGWPSRTGPVRAVPGALAASGFVVLAQFALFLVIGVALWAFYRDHPPAVPFAKADHVFARFIVEEMPPGVRGLLLGAVFSAAMSTRSSSLNSSATALVTDIFRMTSERHGRSMLRATRACRVHPTTPLAQCRR